jgi:hypothetical protein
MMGYSTDPTHIKSAKTAHRCSWCDEHIEVGSEYTRYRYFDGGDAGTVKLHPECYVVMQETAREEGYDYEFLPGKNPRGCNCGFSHGCPTCETRKAAKDAATNQEGQQNGGRP